MTGRKPQQPQENIDNNDLPQVIPHADGDGMGVIFNGAFDPAHFQAMKAFAHNPLNPAAFQAIKAFAHQPLNPDVPVILVNDIGAAIAFNANGNGGVIAFHGAFGDIGIGHNLNIAAFDAMGLGMYKAVHIDIPPHNHNGIIAPNAAGVADLAVQNNVEVIGQAMDVEDSDSDADLE